jgi:hypothetical protein
MKDDWFFLVPLSFIFTVLAFTMFFIGIEEGKRRVKGEAVIAGHATWAFDKDGNPKFHWKE